jgi:ABC-type multidrug transport system fused ATPase/permease subunit
MFLKTTRPLNRLDSTTISPIFASFRTSLEGMATIRAFSAERRFLDTMMKHLDKTIKCQWNYWMVNRWLLVRFDWMGSVTVVVVIILVVITGEESISQENQGARTIGGLFAYRTAGLSSGFEALAIATAMGFIGAVNWACRAIAEMELDLK